MARGSPLLLYLVLENSPACVLASSREEWIHDAIRTKHLSFLRILTETIGFKSSEEYLSIAVGIEKNIMVIEYLTTLKYPDIDTYNSKLVYLAVENGAVENLKWLLRKGFSIEDNDQIIRVAARKENNIPMLEYLVSSNCSIHHTNTLIDAVENEALENLKWFLKEGFPFDNYRIFEAAIESGSLDIMKWLKNNNCRMYRGGSNWCNWDKMTRNTCSERYASVFIAAARQGSLDNMKWLFKIGCPINHPKIMQAAMAQGTLENIQWLYKNGCPLSEKTIVESVGGSFETLQWLLEEHNCAIKALPVFLEAAEHGSLEMMQWMDQRKLSVFDARIAIVASKNDSQDILKWMRANNSRFSIKPADFQLELENIAEQGWFGILKELSAMGCNTRHSSIEEAAARNGSLDILKWLRENGCTFERTWTFRTAARQGSLENLKWLKEINCPMDDPSILQAAARHGSLENLQWLWNNGCPLGRSVRGRNATMIEAAENGSLRNLKWLVDQGCTINNSKIFSAAAKQGSLRNMKWLFENGCSIDDSRIFVAAAEYGSLCNMQWLLEHGCPIDNWNILLNAGDSEQNIKWLLKNGCPRYRPNLKKIRDWLTNCRSKRSHQVLS